MSLSLRFTSNMNILNLRSFSYRQTSGLSYLLHNHNNNNNFDNIHLCHSNYDIRSKNDYPRFDSVEKHLFDSKTRKSIMLPIFLQSKIESSPEITNDSSDTLLLSKSTENQNDAKPSENNDKQSDPSRASEEQLSSMCRRLANHLPQFFKKPHDFRMYNPNIVFEDNIRDIRTVGLNAYAWQITRIKVGAHLKYGKVTFNILKMTQHVEDSTIKLRWRIVTYPGNQIVWAFWRFKLWNVQESLEKHQDEWIDGFSILHIGNDGLIHKHICDKVMPDLDGVKKDSRLAEKLAGVA